MFGACACITLGAEARYDLKFFLRCLHFRSQSELTLYERTDMTRIALSYDVLFVSP